MKSWVLVFSPETYEIVKAKKKIGVRDGVKKRFFEKMSRGDRFVGYISQSKIFDCVGKIESDAFGEESFDFHPDRLFPWRRKVTFAKTGLKKPADNLFNGIQPFNRTNTSPGNLLAISGGFVEISAEDYEWLVGQLK